MNFQKKIIVTLLTLGLFPLNALAIGDLVLSEANVKLSTQTLLEGRVVRIYATVTNAGTEDLRGFVRFFDGNVQIHSDQPISVIAGKDDAVFIDWAPGPGEHNLRIALIPFDQTKDIPSNNSVTKSITVHADTDRDGIPNSDDPDDDNDGVPDEKDSFPLNKNETIDSDGDSIGNNADTDDDNDSVPDATDAVPLNANEQLDTDKDGIGDNEDTDDDGDGLSDIDELKKGTDLLKVDTDADSVNDKDDLWPLDPQQSKDTDRDGVSDEKDTDADGDGIPKSQDVNDANIGPTITVTTNGKFAQSFAYPNEIVEFSTTTSKDDDGSIVRVEWQVISADGVLEATGSTTKPTGTSTPALDSLTLAEEPSKVGTTARTKFSTPGRKTIKIKATDDKGESREKVLTVFVLPSYFNWLVGIAGGGLLILAILAALSYSKLRRFVRRITSHK